MMKRRKLKSTNIEITPIIMGCWQAGKTYWQNIDDQESIDAMKAAFDIGITTFDTAYEYGDGYSEQILGKALKDVRNEVVIATKVFSDSLKYDLLIESCHKSLKNLNTDYIDLYQIHWPAGSWGTEIVPIEETMSALNKLKEQGKIRAIGVSNFSVAQLQEAMNYAEIASAQPPYSLFFRHAEEDLLPFCVKNGLNLLAYSPLAQGLLTGRYNRSNFFPKDELRSKSKLCEPHVYEAAQQALEELQPIADKLNLSLTQLALAWLIAQPNTSAIVGVRNAKQIRENWDSVSVKLDNETLERVSKIGLKVYALLDKEPVQWRF